MSAVFHSTAFLWGHHIIVWSWSKSLFPLFFYSRQLCEYRTMYLPTLQLKGIFWVFFLVQIQLEHLSASFKWTYRHVFEGCKPWSGMAVLPSLYTFAFIRYRTFFKVVLWRFSWLRSLWSLAFPFRCILLARLTVVLPCGFYLHFSGMYRGRWL